MSVCPLSPDCPIAHSQGTHAPRCLRQPAPQNTGLSTFCPTDIYNPDTWVLDFTRTGIGLKVSELTRGPRKTALQSLTAQAIAAVRR